MSDNLIRFPIERTRPSTAPAPDRNTETLASGGRWLSHRTLAEIERKVVTLETALGRAGDVETIAMTIQDALRCRIEQARFVASQIGAFVLTGNKGS